MKRNIIDFISNFLKWLLLAGAVSYFFAYLTVVFFRFNYPFELIWLEGAYVDHVSRILNGYKYYAEPSIEFVSSIYAPLYFNISALLAKITGVGFLPLRLISIASSFGSFLVIYVMVKRDTGDRYAGIIASCLFAATFYLTGAHFDIGRVDSLFLFLLLLSMYVLKFYESRRSYILAGVLISLSFMTKQTALIILLPIMLYCILVNRRIALFYIMPIVLIVGMGSILLNVYYDGWYNFYVFELPRTTPVDSRILLTFWPKDIIMPMGIAFSLGMVYLLSQYTEKDKKNYYFYLMAVAGTFIASWYSRYRIGFTNVLIPSYAVISILFGLGLHKSLKLLQGSSPGRDSLMRIFIYLICIVQFASGSLIYNPLDQIPTESDLKTGKYFVERLSQINGDILIFNHGYLSVMAGKKSYANIMGTRDVFFTDNKKHIEIRDKLIDEFRLAMRENKFGAVILDSVETCGVPGSRDFYTLRETLFKDDNNFVPVTGTKTRPDLIYVPKPAASDKEQ